MADSKHGPEALADPGRPASPQAPSITTPKTPNNSAFRNVSACERCRKRKNRCDKRFPQCSSCAKAGVSCVGFDPITDGRIPRSYLYHLETRCAYLEGLLRDNAIPFADGGSLAHDKVDEDTRPDLFSGDAGFNFGETSHEFTESASELQDEAKRSALVERDQNELSDMFESVGMNSARGGASRNLASASGVTFTRICAAAIKRTISHPKDDNEDTTIGETPPRPIQNDTDSMRDSFFALHARPSSKPATFPEKILGKRLMENYFNYAYPQLPILHKGQTLEMVDNVYKPQYKRSSQENFLLNIVFAIGSGVFIGRSDETEQSVVSRTSDTSVKPAVSSSTSKRRRMSTHQHEPEEYHAAAMQHFESFLGSRNSKEQGSIEGFEELQAILLLAHFALLRPIAPGLWYIVGVAVRLALDLKLHHEVAGIIPSQARAKSNGEPFEHRRAQAHWIQDMRRRLFWCTYSLDRLVSSCVGRPYSIPDHVISTGFPSPVPDEFILPDRVSPNPPTDPSPKWISYHYFRLRLLQSEILHVLQQLNAQRALNRKRKRNPYMHTLMASPFLQNYRSFHDWRRQMDQRLLDWKQDAPTQEKTDVQFSPLYLDLNYWQAILLLFRTSLVAPPELAEQTQSLEDEDLNPAPPHMGNDHVEGPEHAHKKLAEAGKEVIEIYSKLHQQGLVNYTYLATHHLFMAGVSFLYAIWHSKEIRGYLTVHDLEAKIQGASTVFSGLIPKCPPARTSRNALIRIGKAVAKLLSSRPTMQGQFGTRIQSHNFPEQPNVRVQQTVSGQVPTYPQRLQFDTNLNDLFGELQNSDPSSFGSIRDLPNSLQGYEPSLNSAQGADFQGNSPLDSVPQDQCTAFLGSTMDFNAQSPLPEELQFAIPPEVNFDDMMFDNMDLDTAAFGAQGNDIGLGFGPSQFSNVFMGGEFQPSAEVGNDSHMDHFYYASTTDERH